MNFINKVNKYLLEHYPLIWNTRLVWMIGINILAHILFFIIGFSAVNEIEDLKQHYDLSSYFFESSAVYYNFLFSIVIVLIWVIFYLRNNAFKNSYSLPKLFLFKQFCIIIFIFFISISQYFSFITGIATKIKLNYNWEEADADIKTFNKTAIFLAQNQSDYTINNKQYPKPFPLKLAYSDKFELNRAIDNANDQEENYDFDDNLNANDIDVTKPYIVKNKLFYQFYTIDENLWLKDKEFDSDLNEYSKNNFKYRIVEDVSQFKHLIKPSLLNYSKVLFQTGQDSLANQSQLKYYQKILNNGDESEIKAALNTFLKLTDKYKIDHNLNADTWYKLTFDKPNYFLTLLINQSVPNGFKDYSNTKSRFYDEVPYSDKMYLSFGNTDNVFKNIYEAYFIPTAFWFIYFFIGFAYFLALILFIFKTTSIKNVLLSIVASILILVIIVWLMTSFSYSSSDSDLRIYIIMTFISFAILLFSVVGYVSKWKKVAVNILWSLGLFAFPIFILFSILYSIKKLRLAHLQMYPKDYSYNSGLEIWFGNYGFWLILVSALVAVYLYSAFITKLKAQPE